MGALADRTSSGNDQMGGDGRGAHSHDIRASNRYYHLHMMLKNDMKKEIDVRGPQTARARDGRRGTGRRSPCAGPGH